MHSMINDQLWKVIEQEKLDDPSWVLSLEEDDEPPLFTRLTQVDFLYNFPFEERGPAVLNVLLILLQRIEECIKKAELLTKQRIFCYVTLSDFDDWRQNEQVIPTPAIYVNPHYERIPVSSHSFVEAHSKDGLQIQEWLCALNPKIAGQFCVMEHGEENIDPVLFGVYVGWKVDPSDQLISIGKKPPR